MTHERRKVRESGAVVGRDGEGLNRDRIAALTHYASNDNACDGLCNDAYYNLPFG